MNEIEIDNWTRIYDYLSLINHYRKEIMKDRIREIIFVNVGNGI